MTSIGKREIKFRAWDKKTLSMYWNIFLDSWWTLNPYLSEGIKFDDLEFMQYTNLQDKNKNEIYEGDILLADTDENFEYYAIVSWDKSNGCWTSMDEKFDPDGEYLPQYWDSYELVGNIYENQKLLREN